jgi:hypothetical protein
MKPTATTENGVQSLDKLRKAAYLWAGWLPAEVIENGETPSDDKLRQEEGPRSQGRKGK